MLLKIKEKTKDLIIRLQVLAEQKNNSKFQKWAEDSTENREGNWAILKVKKEAEQGNLNILGNVNLTEVSRHVRVYWSRYKLYISLGSAFMLLALIGANLITTTGYSVLVNNQVVANVEAKDTAEQAVSEFISEQKNKYKREVKTIEKIEIKEAEVKEISISSIKDVKAELAENVHLVTKAAGIQINGKVELYVSSKKDCEAIISDLAKPTGLKIINASTPETKFREKVEIVSVMANPKEIVSNTEALRTIRVGKEKAITYKVKEGDTLWTIARAQDMRVKQIREANPSLTGEHLAIDQVINLNKVLPLVNVESILTATVNEVIPYSTTINKVSSMNRGSKKVLQEGANGARKVTYQLVLLNGQAIAKKPINTVVLKPAKAKVVSVGTKWILASRGGGSLSWPTRGPITSGYGARWGRLHQGIDIDGNTGDPIGAAQEGRVVVAGWHYEYGKAIIIDHGNGTSTLYGHLSSVNVSVGDHVSKGQFIGKLGNTGRSTGSHLHFEVRINGAAVNPMRYL